LSETVESAHREPLPRIAILGYEIGQEAKPGPNISIALGADEAVLTYESGDYQYGLCGKGERAETRRPSSRTARILLNSLNGCWFQQSWGLRRCWSFTGPEDSQPTWN